MFQVHPRYVKRKRIRFFQRIVNGLVTFINTFLGGLMDVLKSPVAGLQAFAQLDVRYVDEEEMARDFADHEEGEGEGEEEGEGPHVLRLEVAGPDDEEEWKKRHKEILENEEED